MGAVAPYAGAFFIAFRACFATGVAGRVRCAGSTKSITGTRSKNTRRFRQVGGAAFVLTLRRLVDRMQHTPRDRYVDAFHRVIERLGRHIDEGPNEVLEIGVCYELVDWARRRHLFARVEQPFDVQLDRLARVNKRFLERIARRKAARQIRYHNSECVFSVTAFNCHWIKHTASSVCCGLPPHFKVPSASNCFH